MNRSSRLLHGYTLSAEAHAGAPDDAPLLVFVHGMMEPAAVWEPLLQPLRCCYRCVTLDLPWNGLQGGLWGRHLDPQDWLRNALELFDLRPDAWVAHSFGASALVSLLAEGRTQRGREAPMALISPFYKASHHEVTWPLFQRYVNQFTDFVDLSIRTRMASRPVDDAVLRRMAEAARDQFGCYVWTEFWRLFAGMPFLDLRRLRQPVLLLTGDEDFSSPLPDLQALQRALPSARLQAYAGASHFLLNSRRQLVIQAIEDFLLTHRAPVLGDVDAA